jgi:hypothetical protein
LLLRFSGAYWAGVRSRLRLRSIDRAFVWEDFTMSRAKQASKPKHRACAIPLLGAAGLSLSLASGAPAATVGPAAHEITLGEEEISDVTLATFYVFDKENSQTYRPLLQLTRCGCGGCGGRGCGGCGGRGCGGCRGCHGCGGCGGGGCVGVWWGGCGGCGGGNCWIWTRLGWVWAC